MRKKVLVTGSTGATGSKTVKFLIDAGAGVRAFVHREDERSAALAAQGAEIVRGDLLDFEVVRAALEGTQGAYFVYPIMPGILQATAYFAQAAKEAAIEIVVNMSQISARREAKSHAAQDHWISEQIFNWSGVPVTHLRPTLFAEWALYWTDRLRQALCGCPSALESMHRSPRRSGPRDHENPSRAGRAQRKGIPALRRKEYTFAEIAIEIAKVIGKPVGYEQVDAWTLKRMAANSPREILRTDTIWQHFAEIAKDHQNGVFAGTNNLVEKTGGKRPIGLAEFLEANRSAFLS